ncbi:MAG: P-II family nitrogen regulator [Vicinamibacterales bacterium]
MYEIKAIIRRERLEDVLRGLHAMQGVPGATVSVVKGYGRRQAEGDDSPAAEFGEVDVTKLELVVPETLVDPVTSTIQRLAHTGRAGDGKIFVLPVTEAIKVRSGARGPDAL